jgi:hypothetical protein
MEIRSFIPYLILIGLMAVAALALAFTVDVSLSDRAGVVMHLPASLDEWTGDELRYSHNKENPKQYTLSDLEIPDTDPETGEPLFTMSLSEYQELPQDTQFVKSIYTNRANGRVFVSIVLSGKERNSIHRPQRCLVGQGNSIVDTERFEIPLVGRDTLKVDILKTNRKYRDAEGKEAVYYGYYAYWFVGQNRETPSHYERMFWLAWDRVVHSVAHKWAYIAVSGQRAEDDSDDGYKQEITDFIQTLYPHLLVSGNSNGEG